MKQIIVNIAKNKSNEYPIIIGSNFLEKISSLVNLNNYSKVFVVTDENLKHILNNLLKVLPNNTQFIVLPSSEKEKNIMSVQKIWTALLKGGYDRKSVVLNLGGGVVCDLGGFSAATFMRGIDFINIPTTLLSQVDASVGGKTGIDFDNLKNLIGTFTQPKAVIIDTNLLEGLPKREFLSGFAEIIKHGLIKDKIFFEQVVSKHPLEFNQEELADIIFKSVQIKKDIVEMDESEGDIRKILNFGHTIGHAVEALGLKNSKYLLHGEAISIGMVAEARISVLLGILSKEDLKIIEQSLISAELPISIDELNIDQVIKLMNSDKKNEKGKINFTLLSTIGKALINQNPPLSIVEEALQ